MSTSTDTQKKYVWVSFITYSPFIWLITGRTYTHAAIGLDGENGPFYSFRYRGFGREYFQIPHRIKRKYYCSQFVSEILLEAGL